MIVSHLSSGREERGKGSSTEQLPRRIARCRSALGSMLVGASQTSLRGVEKEEKKGSRGRGFLSFFLSSSGASPSTQPVIGGDGLASASGAPWGAKQATDRGAVDRGRRDHRVRHRRG